MDSMSVVDLSSMRVHGIDGLRVTDASVMPYVTNGNIYAPVMMMAEKAADLVLGNTPLTPRDVVFYRHGGRDAARGDHRADCTGRRSGLAEVRVALLEAGGIRLDLVRTADQGADLLLLRREAGRQVGPPGEVEQPLQPPGPRAGCARRSRAPWRGPAPSGSGSVRVASPIRTASSPLTIRPV